MYTFVFKTIKKYFKGFYLDFLNMISKYISKCGSNKYIYKNIYVGVSFTSRFTICCLCKRHGDSDCTVFKSHMLRMSRSFRLKADMKSCNKSVSTIKWT